MDWKTRRAAEARALADLEKALTGETLVMWSFKGFKTEASWEWYFEVQAERLFKMVADKTKEVLV